MDNLQIVKDITDAFCENRLDDEVLEQYFAKDFEHVVNGRRTDLRGYAEHLDEYMREYKRFRIPAWDELFAAGDRVVSAYTLEAERPDGRKEEMEVMAVWRLRDGKVTSLHEVDAPHEG